MISNPMKYLGTLALLLALTVVLAMRPVDAEAGPFENARMKLLIKGMDPDEAMADRAKLILTLKDYGVPRPPGSIRKWLDDIEVSNAPVLQGLGGISAWILLGVASETVNPGVFGHFVNRPGVDIFGQINEFCEPDGTGDSGYAYNSVDGSGRLCVTIVTTTTLGNSNMEKKVAMRFRVDVENNGFVVEDKDLTFASNVFPDFAREAGLSVNSNTATGFNYKLWASGTSIRVIDVWIADPYVPGDPPAQFHKIDSAANPDDAKYDGLFLPDPDACIDMMFAGDPPSSLPAGAAPPFYCLGRCANPPIINTR